ncbi:helix-turn-helix domain-containing protein [Halomonas campaniensis]|uniref:helix-turn-helix domain-containing protein n=1 Tax=Halomonas campaniensis TaxID=213554 RepID=UPI000B535799|nr:helix-turn-helix transcriptional regulator [Halomonas campaniensis]
MTRQTSANDQVNVQAEKVDAFGERVAIAINRVGGSTKMAEIAGVSTSVLSKWRRGESDPSRSRLIKMASAAGISLEWLATGEGPMVVEYGRAADKEPVRVEELDAYFAYAHKADVERAASEQEQPSPIPNTIYARLVGPLYELVPDDLGMREAVLERSVNILRAATNDDPVEMLLFEEEELRAIVTSARAAYKIAKRRRGV